MNKLKIGIITLALVVAGTASAALVSYLSNAVNVDTTVASPIVMTTDISGVVSPSYGGESFTFTTIAENKSNQRIGGYYVMVIEATDGNDAVTGEEFTSIMYTINEGGYTGEDGEILDKLCVVHGDGSLTPFTSKVWNNKKLVLFYDYDGMSTYVHTGGGGVEGTGYCSDLVVFNDSGETRSHTHLNANAARTRTFTPTWATNVVGNFTISSQYVYDLAAFADETYFPAL